MADRLADRLAGGSPGDFAFFLFSHTNDPEAWVAEETVFAALIDTAPAGCPVFYRHRRDNCERKARNIADWVNRWGGAYEAMIVLDADSLIAPETMIEMTRRLAAELGLGLIQTLPGIIAGRSLFARLQQFANRCYGPIFGNGLAAWHGNGGNFWGHNAIIRTAAFAASSRLPHLAGNPPFGDDILSHDFVEAALLRRAGWGGRFDTDLQYSFEEAPPSLVDVMIRDRRWCQGNLQHGRMMTALGIPPSSRLHMLSGILGYLSAPFWLLLVVVGFVLAVQVVLSGPNYFPGPSLFPIWPVFEPERAIRLFILSMGVLLTPKFLGWTAAAVNLHRCRAFGGPVLLTLSAGAQIFLSAPYAPVLILVQTQFVWQVLRGGDSGWKPQRRGDGGMTLRDTLRIHFWHATIGLLAALGAWAIDGEPLLWTGALILSPITSSLSGSKNAGDVLRPLAYCGRPKNAATRHTGFLLIGAPIFPGGMPSRGSKIHSPRWPPIPASMPGIECSSSARTRLPRSARPCSLPAQRPNAKTIPTCYRTGSRRKKNGLFCMMRSWFRHFLPQNHGFCGPSPPDRRPRTRRRPAHLRRTAILACAPGSSSTAARSGNSTGCRNQNRW